VPNPDGCGEFPKRRPGDDDGSAGPTSTPGTSNAALQEVPGSKPTGGALLVLRCSFSFSLAHRGWGGGKLLELMIKQLGPKWLSCVSARLDMPRRSFHW
jgi:hypothetical protein